jgi:DNA integrity scanning protein DisA with diadenylate cyclase activity
MSKEHSAALKSAREQALATHEKAVAAMKQQLAQLHTAELEELQEELDTGTRLPTSVIQHLFYIVHTVKAKQDALTSLKKELSATKVAKQQELADEVDALVAAHDTAMKALHTKHADALKEAATSLQQQQLEREQEVRLNLEMPLWAQSQASSSIRFAKPGSDGWKSFIKRSKP